jgi:hypothetical protein
LGIFFDHHQEFSTVHSALVSFMQVLMTASKQSQDGTPWSSILTLLCPSSGVFYCKFGIGKFHTGFDDRFQAESGWNSMEFHRDSALPIIRSFLPYIRHW